MDPSVDNLLNHDLEDEGIELLKEQGPVQLHELRLVQTLGTGTFGRVFLSRTSPIFPSTRVMHYAIKILSKAQIVKLKQVEHINNERRILSLLHHPFLVNLVSSFQSVTNLFMVMEFVQGGELFTHLRRAGRFSNDVARFYIAEIVLAIEYLHCQDVIYRDLKPENLLLDREGHIKITDFGFAKVVTDRTWTLCGTPEYLAPEIIQSKGHGKPVDWWALGILAFEMLAGYPPFFADNPFGIYEKILAGKIVFPMSISDMTARDLICRLLTADRTRRLGNLAGGAEDVKRHLWFYHLNWTQIALRATPGPILPVNRFDGDSCNFERYPEPSEEEWGELEREMRGEDTGKFDELGGLFGFDYVGI